MTRHIVPLIALLLISTAVHAEVELKAQGMTIFGQSELPKVLYIVPWKRKELPDVEAPRTVSLLDDVLTPIDPAIFERQVHYYELMMQHLHKEQ